MEAFYTKIFVLCIILLGSLIFSNQVAAQQENRITATTNTSISEEFDLKELKNNQRRKVKVLVITDIRNVPYGNRCEAEATRRLGFVYTPMPINEVERKSRFYYFVHNQVTKLGITLKNGPTWKNKLKKSVKRCG